MAKQSSVNLDITNNADGFDISGGTTVRKLGITGGDVTIAGSGSATVTFPTTSTTIAGLGITQSFSALQSFSAGISASGGVTFSGNISAPNIVNSVNGATGPITNVALTTNTLSQFASTSSAELATLISNETGSGSLVFAQSPAIVTSLTTSSATFALVNTTATTLNLGGAATTFTMGATSGTASIRNPTLTLGNTNNTITTNSGTTNYITIQPYGNLTLAPFSTAPGFGTLPSLVITNTRSALGQVQISGGDLYLGTKSADGEYDISPVQIIFEGATDNTNETTLTVVDPTADRTITFPDASGTVALTSGLVSSLSGSTYISVSGSTGAVTITNTGVQTFNGLTGAVTGVTVGGTNVFTALNTFNAGISAAGGTFSSQTRFLAGISAAGGTFGTDISVFGIRVGRGNQGATNGGDTNLAVGANALNSVVPNPGSYAGIQNLAFGTSALQLTTSGGYNSAFGTEALYTNTTGYGNIAFGVHALRQNTSGAENCAFGGGPMYQNTTGSYNTAIGSLSYYYKSTGNYNVAIGWQAGYNFGTPSSGSQVTSASNCTLIGSFATPLTSGTSNEIVIGYNAIGKGSNTVVLGNSTITATHLTGLVNVSSGLSAAGGVTLAGTLQGTTASFSGDVTATGSIVGNQKINAQTVSYTLALTDNGKIVTMNSASGITATIPLNSSVGFPTGCSVTVVGTGTGTVGFTGSAGVTLRFTPGNILRAQYSAATCVKLATDEWLLLGDLTA